MRLITFEEKDARALIDKLELRRLAIKGEPVDRSTADEIHNAFHYEVVKWLQDQGASCIRGN